MTIENLKADMIINSPEYSRSIKESTDHMIMIIIDHYLSCKHYTLIRKYYFKNLNIKQIAAEMDYAPGHVYRIKKEAISKIARMCEGEDFIAKRLYHLLYHIERRSGKDTEVYRLVKSAYILRKKEFKNKLKRA